MCPMGQAVVVFVLEGKPSGVRTPEAQRPGVLVNVLKAPEHLRYQLAFLSSELREIFAKAPPADPGPGQTEQESNNRKPIEGDCPICFMELSPQSEEII
ncbi:hypothetical protein VTN31DRAFT_833 [Thermomyces dupontii]|uniref:uncharacterized protein n=1 Tax=Talaromyces thermophilus TaxID=28565 RepID=UPI00374493F5